MSLFNRADLFGNISGLKPSYYDPQSGVVDETGKVVGQTQLNPLQYAGDDYAQQIAGTLGGKVARTYATGPGAVGVPQNQIDVGNPNNLLNAGLVGQQLQYATRGRYNADTGKYDVEPIESVMARIASDINQPTLGNTGFVGAQPYELGMSMLGPRTGNGPGGLPVQQQQQQQQQVAQKPGGVRSEPTKEVVKQDTVANPVANVASNPVANNVNATTVIPSRTVGTAQTAQTPQTQIGGTNSNLSGGGRQLQANQQQAQQQQQQRSVSSTQRGGGGVGAGVSQRPTQQAAPVGSVRYRPSGLVSRPSYSGNPQQQQTGTLGVGSSGVAGVGGRRTATGLPF